jgi:lysozyme
VLAEGQDFAFIKATEGSGSVDPDFEANFSSAAGAGLLTGAYHFFSFESPGEAQAENFIRAVGDLSGRLPPVVDVELYGAFRAAPPDPEAVRAILDPLLAVLTARYGAKPILYATSASWTRYLKDGYADYPCGSGTCTSCPACRFYSGSTRTRACCRLRRAGGAHRSERLCRLREELGALRLS